MKQRSPIYRGHIPFVRFLLALLAGIGVGYAIAPQKSAYIIPWAVLVISLTAFIALIWITKLRQIRYYGLMGLAVLSSLAAVGWILTWRPHPQIDSSHFSRHESEALVGYVADEPVIRGKHVRFPFAITNGYGHGALLKLSGQVMLTVAIADSILATPFGYGEELIIPATYDEVAPPYNPGEMDYKSHLANKDIWQQAYVPLAKVYRTGRDRSNPLIAYALALRRHMVAKFDRYIADRDAFSVASTLILGYRADLSQELLQAYSNTGTIHVLSVSGMHVVIVFWLLSKLLWWMDRGRGLRIAKFMLLLLAVWSYALLTGFSPSVLRASIMISFVMAAASFGQQARIYNSIAASAFFLLLYNPKFIADIGFQLSYLAVLGMVYLLPKLQALFPVKNRYGKPIWDYALVSVSAQAGAGPLAAYHFHQFPLYFLPANLLIVLPASGIMYLGFILLVLPPGQLAWWTGYVLEKLILMTNGALSYIEQLPMASISGIWMAWWEYFIIYFLMLAVPLAVMMRSKRLVYGTMGCITLLVCASFSATVQKLHRQEVIIFNVRREIAIGYINQRQTWLYSNLPSLDDRTIRYSALPKMEMHTPVNTIRFISQNRTYADHSVYARGGVLQFGNTRLLVYDGKMSYTRPLEVDVLVLRNNPRISLERLLETISCKQLVLDGSNYDATIRRFEAEAIGIGVPVYVLKHNFAYVWDVEAQSR